jgi:3-oxoacyl-[acyl-carrier protein] reductase
MVEEVKNRFGGLDIVVNNAGILRDKALMLMEEQDWEEVISTNLSGAFNLVRAAIVTFMKQKSGKIINLTSVSGLKGMPRQVNYSASKAGIIGLTKSTAKELAPNIRVNGVSPGSILWPQGLAELSEEEKLNMLDRITLNKQGSTEDIAEAVLFLADAKYITGEVINIDGGRSLNQ